MLQVHRFFVSKRKSQKNCIPNSIFLGCTADGRFTSIFL